MVDQVLFPMLAQEVEADVRAVGRPLEVEEAGLRAVDLGPRGPVVHDARHNAVVVALAQNPAVAVWTARLLKVLREQIVLLLNLLLQPALFNQVFFVVGVAVDERLILGDYRSIPLHWYGISRQIYCLIPLLIAEPLETP